MKEPLQRTKVVIRHLPPSLSQNDLLALFHDHFNDHYNWSTFGPENLGIVLQLIDFWAFFFEILF